MGKKQSKGACLLCNSMFGKAGMTKHLQSCIQKNVISEKASGERKPEQDKKFFHILVEGYNYPEYWIHLKALTNAKLKDLDHFLRDIWLECCGHLSAFEIQGTRYTSSPMAEYNEKGMNKKLGDILGQDIKFFHEYDFGTTTALTLRVVSEGEAETGSKSFQILARNDPPSITCSNCKNSATHICAECIYSGEGWLCDKCAHEHDCGEDMLLPVVNSPRVGMCGYTG
ncbi:MAG: hypothetical protein ABFR82_01845 [Nitrospirota bacterium]